MKTTKPAPRKKLTNRAAGPTASHPHIPGHGIPKSTKGLLPWSHVTQRMAEARHYWVCTVSPDGRPHATPVDGLWLDDRLYFGGSPQTKRNRNLAANPAVCIHLESGSDVVILHGDAHELRRPDRSLAILMADASVKKYGYGMKPEEYERAAGEGVVGRGKGIQLFRRRPDGAWKLVRDIWNSNPS